MAEISMSVKCDELLRVMERIVNKFNDPQPIMEKLGAMAANEVRRNFTVGGRYSSPEDPIGGENKWKPLSKTTIEIKKSQGNSGPYTILKDTGRLSSSIVSKATKDTVTVGTNMVYAALHQFGAKAGQFEMLVKAHIRKRKVTGSELLKSGKPGKIKQMTINTSVKAYMRKSPAIPARPFMNIHPESLEIIIQTLQNNFLKDE